MSYNPARRIFVKKGLCLIATLPFSGCGGGSGSSSATPPPNPPTLPSILSEPLDQTVTAGDTAVFDVIADGTPPLSYQWQRNGVSIPGAVSTSYSTGPVGAGDDALFTVTITNQAGSVTSRSAELMVIQIAITTDSTSYTVDSTSLTVDRI